MEYVIFITSGLISFLIAGIYHFNNVRKNKKLFAIFGAWEIVFGILSIFFELSIVDICAFIGIFAIWGCGLADFEEIWSSTSYLIESVVKSINGAIKKPSSKKEAERKGAEKKDTKTAWEIVTYNEEYGGDDWGLRSRTAITISSSSISLHGDININNGMLIYKGRSYPLEAGTVLEK